jgi:hypothetical protein
MTPSRALSRSIASRLRLKARPALVVDQSQLAPGRRQPRVGIVLAQQQPVLGARW